VNILNLKCPLQMTRNQGKSTGFTVLFLRKKHRDQATFIRMDSSTSLHYTELSKSLGLVFKVEYVKYATSVFYLSISERIFSPPDAERIWEGESSELVSTVAQSSASGSRPDHSRKRPRSISESPEPVQQQGIDNRAMDLITHSASTGPRRSTRLSHRPQEVPPVDPDELILIYPPSVPGAVNITSGDLKRLIPGEFLNDKLIEFGLKFLLPLPCLYSSLLTDRARFWLKQLEDINPSLANDIFIFSSYFYKKMNVKNHEEGYNSVRRWTAKIDLFQKKFLIIPINENLHWYLAIVYLPEYTLLPPLPLSPPKSGPSTRRRKHDPSTTTASVDDSGIEISASVFCPRSAEPPDVLPAAEKNLSEREHELSEMDVEEVAEQLSSSCISGMAERERDSSGSIIDGHDPPHVSEDAREARKSTTEALMEVDRSSPINITEDSPPLPQVPEPDNIMRLDTPSPVSTARSSEVKPASSFYGSRRTRTERRRHSEPENLGVVEVERDSNLDTEEEESSVIITEDVKQTMIFTMDSMGGTHRQVGNVLKSYLSYESKDKKGNDNPNPPFIKKMPVPQQSNYCDCGLYILHFARKFVEQPEHFISIGLQKKIPPGQIDKEWDKSAVAGLRGNLSTQIESLSADWKKHRDEQKRKEQEAAAAGTVKEPESDSDDEICLVEGPAIPEPNTNNASSANTSTDTLTGSTVGSNPVSTTSKQGPVERLR
jgi:Ulp1 family protease